MTSPGFAAEASLAFNSRKYIGSPLVRGFLDRSVLPMQDGLIAPPEPFPIPNPDLPLPNPPPDWPYWPPYYPQEEPPAPPRIPPDIIIDVLEATAEAAAAIGIGILIGAGIGLGVEKAITPPTPVPGTIKPTCKTVGPPTLHKIQESYWGCERSLRKTIASANADCASRPGICAGTCPGGAPCVATATITSGPVQTPGWTSCETYFWYTCDCGC